jgi:hypothetical protein
MLILTPDGTATIPLAWRSPIAVMEANLMGHCQTGSLMLPNLNSELISTCLQVSPQVLPPEGVVRVCLTNKGLALHLQFIASSAHIRNS